MYAIYGNIYIYHQYTPNVSIYTSTMDPMGDGFYWFLEPFWSQDIHRLWSQDIHRRGRYCRGIAGMLQGSTASHMFDDTMMYW